MKFQVFQRVRSLGLVSVLCLGLLALSACVTVDVQSEFNEDGSATHVMELTIDTKDLQQLGEMAGEEGDITESFTDGFDELQATGEREGFRVEKIDEDGVVGSRIIKDVQDNSDLGVVLNEIFNTNTDTTEQVDAFSGSFSEDNGTYRLELTVDGDALTDSAGVDLGSGDASPEELQMFSPDSILDMTYSVTLPGKIDEGKTNGQVGADGRVSWDVPLDGSETFVAVSSRDDGDSGIGTLLIIGGIIGLILLVIAGGLIFMMTRQTSAPVPAAEAGVPAYPAPQPDNSPTYSDSNPDQPTQPLRPANDSASDPAPDGE